MTNSARSRKTTSSGIASAPPLPSTGSRASMRTCSPPSTLSLAAQRPAVHLDRASLDPALQPRARILRQRARQGLVEPQPGGIRGQRQRVRTELRRAGRGRKSSRWIRYTSPVYTARRQRKALLRCSDSVRCARAWSRCVSSWLAAAGLPYRTASKDKKISPEALYKKAHKSLESYDYNGAIKTLRGSSRRASRSRTRRARRGST